MPALQPASDETGVDRYESLARRVHGQCGVCQMQAGRWFELTQHPLYVAARRRRSGGHLPRQRHRSPADHGPGLRRPLDRMGKAITLHLIASPSKNLKTAYAHNELCNFENNNSARLYCLRLTPNHAQ